ncbi:hypothetical protein IVA95_23465 [Bradyrhizobium sp. 157]|uniref:hypothetical protein n=1 Tax=Bradyrhizobium sp. 157 TaxID=2782631 RepID=UPI001FFB2BEB|nr:hypothetical protein [Bradyrhizobium sp. 157]MCK1640461.1 hypothetical protein [Bradyrhizobium sp. 157]
MSIPKLTDVSPELKDALAKYENLAVRGAELREEHQRLWKVKQGGETVEEKEARISAIINGDAPLPQTNIDGRIADINTQWRSIEDAKEVLVRRVVELKRKAGREICQTFRPKHDEIMKRLSESLLKTHAAYVEFERLKRDLLTNECGLYGVFDIEPDFLESPTDRTSSLAQYFREAKAAGYIKAVPAEFR